MLLGMSLPQSCWFSQSYILASALLTQVLSYHNSMGYNRVVLDLSARRINPLKWDGETVRGKRPHATGAAMEGLVYI